MGEIGDNPKKNLAEAIARAKIFLAGKGLRLVGFFLTSYSPHGLLLPTDSIFTKHELLFVLSLYSKCCHTSLSHLCPANNRDRLIFIRQFRKLDSRRPCKFASLKVAGCSVLKAFKGLSKYGRILLNTGNYIGRNLV